jgi:hypothetical protein
MHASRVINPSEAHPDYLEDETWTSHGLKGPQGPKLPQNHVYTSNCHKYPPASHHEKAQSEGAHQGVGRPLGSAESTLVRLISPLHVVLPGVLEDVIRPRLFPFSLL